MIYVPQKFKHCFVACVVSSLEDKRLQDRQTVIVSQFPAELQQGLPNEGVPETKQEFETIIISLGLAQEVLWVDDTNQIQSILTQNANARNDMYLLTDDSKKHCVRIKKVLAHGVEVMNPETDFEIWDWAKIIARQCRLSVFLMATDVARLSHH